MPTTKILPEEVLNKLKRNRRVYQAARRVRMSVGSLLRARTISGIPGKVHFNDFTFDSTRPKDIDHYVRCGNETIVQLEGALKVAGRSWADVRSVLEFGCGYGRITRALIRKVPPSKITVCDLIEEGAEFCRCEFNVKAIPSTPEIADFKAAPSDLLFFISVHTHLSERRVEALQRRLFDLLTPGGICVFTTMGRRSANNAERYGERWAAQKINILKDLDKRGFSFHSYGYYNDPDYGMTWDTYEHTTSLLQRLHGESVRLLQFEEGLVDSHQDFYVYQRIP